MNDPKPPRVCVRCYSELDPDNAFCWVCFNEQQKSTPNYVNQKKTSVGSVFLKTLLAGLFMGLGSIAIAAVIVVVIIASFFAALAEACSGCAAQIVLLAGLSWIAFEVVSSLLGFLS